MLGMKVLFAKFDIPDKAFSTWQETSLSNLKGLTSNQEQGYVVLQNQETTNILFLDI